MDEVRRSYHDLIAGLRDETVALVRVSADAVENVTAALLERDPQAGRSVVAEVADVNTRVMSVENEVLELLARQAPVARDLRIILAALRIAQVADLCVGLARTLGTRAGRSEDAMTPTLRALAYEIGAETVTLLRQAAGAWAALDAALAQAVAGAADAARALQRRAFAELLELDGASAEAVIDLGMAARAYERLTDHAVEIADRVLFVTGKSAPA